MKILHIANGDDCLGSARCLYELLERELQEGIIPIVVTPTCNNMNKWCNDRNIENVSIKYYGFMYPMHDNFGMAKYFIRKKQYHKSINNAVNEIAKMIDLNTIDLIHTNNCLIDFGKKISDKYSIKHIWHLREGGIKPLFLKPYLKNYIPYMEAGNCKFLAVSLATRDEWIKLGIDKNRIITIYDGIEIHELCQRSNNRKNLNIVMCGAINETKGQMMLVNALSKLDGNILKKIHVDIYGNCTKSYMKKLTKQIKKLNLEEVIIFKGFISNVWNVLGDYDVGINCTNFEAFGRVTIEYLMSGMPVIVSNTGANPEIINNEKFGKVFKYGDIDDLAQSISFMLENICSYKKNDKILNKYAIKNYSIEKNSHKIIELFKNECLQSEDRGTIK